jgi:NADH-quinone oxidoreductase subunit M
MRGLRALPAYSGILVAGALVGFGVYALARIALFVLPNGTQWAARTLGSFAALGALIAAVRCLRAPDLATITGRVATFHVAIALLGLSSLTAIGIEGTIVMVISSSLSIAVLCAVRQAIERRVATSELARLGGLARELPPLALFAAVALLSALGAAGASGFVALLLVLLGAFPVQKVVVLAGALAIAILAYALARAFARLFLGEMPRALRDDVMLEAHGGRMPALEEHEFVVFVPLCVLIIALGVAPRPLLVLIDAAVFDAASSVNRPGPMQIVEHEAAGQHFAVRR